MGTQSGRSRSPNWNMRQSTPATQNHIVAALSQTTLDRLRPYLHPVPLPLRLPIERPHESTTHVVFPQSGVISYVAGTGHKRAEVGLVGREGVSGIWSLLGSSPGAHECLVQIAGHGLMVPTTEVRAAAEADPQFREQLLIFARSLFLQITETAFANARARIRQRLARWLLMAHDRLHADDIQITHEFLSLMLGVTRPGITLALHALEEHKAIRSTHSRVTVLDRPKLQEIAGEFYSPLPWHD